MRHRLLSSAACLLLVAGAMLGQSPAFEVASVKPAAPGDGPMKGEPKGSISLTAGNLTMRNVSLGEMILTAYGIKEHQLSGPAFLKTDRYDVIAKAGNAASADQMKVMLQALLAERFKLVVHRDSKDLAVDAMVPGKNPPKIGNRKPDGPANITIDGAKLIFQNYTMASLADYLSQRSPGRPIIDATGIEGTYDLPVQIGDSASDDPIAAKRALGQAMRDGSFSRMVAEQLGLKLETRKGPTEIITVDHAERSPTAN